MEEKAFKEFLYNPNLNDIYAFAEYLMNHYCINNGTNRYQLLEIEIYNDDLDYNQAPKDQRCDKNLTYPRIKQALELFYHYTGMDICFPSNGKQHSGGVLIRAVKILNGDIDTFIGGPLKLKDVLLNEAKKQLCVEYVEIEKPIKLLSPTWRIGVNTNRSDKKWRFIVEGYDNKIKDKTELKDNYSILRTTYK